MAKNKKELDGILEKMALVSEAVQDIFIDSKPTIIFEMEKESFKELQDNFRDIDKKFDKFRIEISNVDFIILNSDSPQQILEKEIILKKPKQTFLSRLKNLFNKSSKSSIKG
jgi:hypothetical protein